VQEIDATKEYLTTKGMCCMISITVDDIQLRIRELNKLNEETKEKIENIIQNKDDTNAKFEATVAARQDELSKMTSAIELKAEAAMAKQLKEEKSKTLV
jgi:putative sterol carrier protein